MNCGEISTASDAESDPIAVFVGHRPRHRHHQASGSSSHASSLENTPTTKQRRSNISQTARSATTATKRKLDNSIGASSLMAAASNGRFRLSGKQQQQQQRENSDVLELRSSNKSSVNQNGNRTSRLSLSAKLTKQRVNKALRHSLGVTGAQIQISSALQQLKQLGRPRRRSPTLLLQQQLQQPLQQCPVQGCDSRGHLSGRLPWHSTPAACPLYHNVTAEHCANIAEQRINSLLSNNAGPAQDPTSSIAKRLRLSTSTGPSSPEKVKNHVGIKRLKHLRKQSAAVQAADPGAATVMITPPAIIPSTTPSIPTSTRSAPSVAIRQPSLDGLGILPCDRELFFHSQAASVEDIGFEQALSRALMPPPVQPVDEAKPKTEAKAEKSPNYRLKWIAIGGIRVAPWYQSPYPDEYVAVDTLFICEFCFRYFRTEAIYRRHLSKCVWRHPPGDEIYRKDEYSIFEVDGNSAKLFCQNLCLFAKLFIANKTLFYEVETFLFYVLTKNDPNGCHTVGYFSKEKHSLMNCNLSCLLVFPSQSRRGYGKFLIDFSYLLSRLEGRIGSPERPLSDLGLLTYRSYWKEVIVNYLGLRMDSKTVSIKDISDETGIHRNDVVSTLQVMGILKYWKNRNIILKKTVLERELGKLQKEATRKKHHHQQQKALDWHVDASFLRWTPRNRKQNFTLPSSQ